MSKKKTGCMTCAIGCGVLVIIGIVLMISGSIWITQKGQFDQTRSILSNEADFYVQLKLGEKEEALVEFFQRLGEQANKGNPVFEKFPILENWNQKKTEKDLKKLLPLRVEFQGVPELDEFQFSVGFSLYNRIASIIYYFAEKSAEKNGRLYHLDPYTYFDVDLKDKSQLFISLNQSIFYLSSSRQSMEALLTGTPITQEAHFGSSYLSDIDLQNPVYGYLTNSAIQPQTLTYFGIEDLEGWDWFSRDVFSRIAIDMRVGDGEALVGKVLFDLADPGYKDLVKEKLESLREDLQVENKFDFTIYWREIGDTLIMDYELSNFELPTGTMGTGPGIKIRTSRSHEE